MTPRRELAISIVLSALAVLVGLAAVIYATGCEYGDEGAGEGPWEGGEVTHGDMVALITYDCRWHEWDDAAFAQCIGHGLTAGEVHDPLWEYHYGPEDVAGSIDHLADDLLTAIEGD